MDPVLAALADQHAELDGLLTDLDDDGWARPTRCEGWSVADVVLHLAQTDAMAVASLDGRLAEEVSQRTRAMAGAANVDEGADLMVALERGEPGPAVGERWRSGAAELRSRFDASDLHGRVSWVAGELTARTLATTRLAEAWIHTGDVADAVGTTLRPTDRLWHIARLAWRTLPYAFARDGRELHGPVAFELRGPGGEEWALRPDTDPVTTVRGEALELCLVAGRRAAPADTSLEAVGVDGAAVLDLVRTYA